MPHKKKILLLLLILVSHLNGISQVKRIFVSDTKGTYKLEKKQLTYDNGICGYINNLLNPYASRNISSIYGDVLDRDFVFESNHFIQTKKTLSSTLQECEIVKNIAEDGHHITFQNNIFD